MKEWKIEQLYTLDETIAAAIFDGGQYPWEVLGKIKDFIVELGNSLPEDKFEKRGENIWVAKSAHIFPAHISGDRLSSMRRRKSATALLSEEALL